MRAADFFAKVETLPFCALTDLVDGGGLVVVAPHPDDESLGCGGLIADACTRGIAVRLIVVSDGAGSHPGSRRWPSEALRDLREDETRAAAAALGLSADAIRFLRLPDRFVPSEGLDAEAAAAAVGDAVRAIDAGLVCVTWRHDPHCDHRAAAAIVDRSRQALGRARVLAYPIWGWTLPPEQDVGPAPRGWRVDVSRHRTAKRVAVAAHRSQVSDLIDDCPDGFRLTPEMIDRFDRPWEVLLEAA